VNRKQHEGCTLADALDLLEDASEFTCFVSIDAREREVEFIDDYGLSCGRNAEFFVAGLEFGPQVLVHAKGYQSAWEAWIDEVKPIPEDELIEAYGIVDDYREEYEKLNPQPNTSEHEARDAWWTQFRAACVERLKTLSDAARETGNDYPELIEGYEYQSNSSGTGIVAVGHYAWMREIDPSDVRFVRKAETEDK
jgi:hypothetical protein